MEIVAAIFPQITQMFLLMGVGYFLFKKEKISDATTKQISWILVNIVIPCVLFGSFIRTFNMEEFKQFGVVMVMSFVAILLGILYTRIVYKKEETLEQFAVVFSNASFIGIPIISALFGGGVLFYLSAYIAVFVLIIFTYGVFIISQDKKEIQIQKVLTNSNVAAILCGMLIYGLSIPIPRVLTDTIRTLGSMNTPLSMILLGVYLAKDSLKPLFTDKKAYFVLLGRLVIVPVLTILVMSLFPVDPLLKIVVVVVNSVPSAVMLALFAQLYQRDTIKAAQYVSFTTLASLGTLPFVVYLAQMILL